MTRSNGTAATVVAYYRMSDDKQENSIDRQRSQVEPFARKHGYAIAHEYLDEGVPSDDVRRRKAFQQLLADCAAGKVGTILVDDKDRFGRFDSIDQGYYVKPLRDRGVKLVTVAQGLVDWNSFGGRISDAVLSEARNLEVRAMARRVATACARLAQQGEWLGGPVPYAFRLETAGGKKRLVPGDPQQVEAVRLIFRLVGDHGWSLGKIVQELHARRIPSPAGKPLWRRPTLRKILKNRRYVGDGAYGVRSVGKYSRCQGGTVVDATEKHSRLNPPEIWTVVPGTHEGLVDRDLWERAQRSLARNKNLTTPHLGGGEFLLTGLLVCGHCGGRLSGCTFDGKRYYQCNTRSSCRQACLGYSIAEDRLVRSILDTLQEGLYSPETVARLEVILQEEAAALEAEGPARRQKLTTDLEALDRVLAQAGERMLLIPQEELPVYLAAVRAKRQERDQAAAELRELEHQQPTAEAAALVAEARARMQRLRDVMLSADPAEVRSFLRSLVQKVELYFDVQQLKRTRRYHFREGTITVFCQNGSLTDLSLAVHSQTCNPRPATASPGRPASTCPASTTAAATAATGAARASRPARPSARAAAAP
jgi:DNA invertase Pin-like site-specific DNA recombinase